MEREWRSYYQHRRRPRVSYDTNDPAVQTTSWLQLPFSFSTILILLSMALHWVVSHAITVEEQISQRESYELKFSAGASMMMGITSGLLVSGITALYFIPIQTWMPLMSGSLRVVLYFTCHLKSGLPRDGISWGDISTESVFRAGFGSSTEPMHSHIVYPSVIDSRPDI
jgi:hypothetical protein